MCEILAPSGDINSAYAAINSGANAIYLGLTSFSARSSAQNFDMAGFGEISRYAHAFGIKVYVAMNTLIKDSELPQFLNTLIEVWNSGADAIILSDIFLGKFIKDNYPSIRLHLSTQAGVCNAYGAKLAKRFGFERVVLARETPIDEIKKISEIIETEVFIQGALCTCFSGQCYMSSFAGGNSGNRGKCKQPCRKLYSINRNGFEDLAYRLSLADLSVGGNIRQLIEAGVSSFKIEGRMRRPEYVAAAVKYYKNILNKTESCIDLSNLKRTYNRGNYTKGLAFGQDKTFISSDVQGHIGEYVGVLKVENGKYCCYSNEKFGKGDCFKVLRGGKEVGGADFVENSEKKFTVSSKSRLRSGDKLFITTDASLNGELIDGHRKINVKLSVRLCRGERAAIEIGSLKVYGEEILEVASTRPLTEADIKNCFGKVDKYPFEIEFISIVTDGVFMPASALNALRRKVYAEYYDYISATGNVQVIKNHLLPKIKNEPNTKIAVITPQKSDTGADLTIYKPDDYNFNDCGDCNKFLFLPPFMTSHEIEKIKPAIKKFKGIYCDGSWGIELASELQMPFFAGCGINISNSVDVNLCTAEYIALSKELTVAEQKALSRANVFALASGDIKVMDLIYCPFGKRCADCDKKPNYILTDENGRNFPLRRYKTSVCRFEVFNCANLVGVSPVGTLLDCTVCGNTQKLVKIAGDGQAQMQYFKNYTRGHANSPVL